MTAAVVSAAPPSARAVSAGTPSEVYVAFDSPAPGDPSDPCRTGTTFARGDVGDHDEITVCTFDSDGNAAPTQSSSHHLRWDISPKRELEPVAFSFNPAPPKETVGPGGSAGVAVDTVRGGDNFVDVFLVDGNGDVIDHSSLRKVASAGDAGVAYSSVGHHALGSASLSVSSDASRSTLTLGGITDTGNDGIHFSLPDDASAWALDWQKVTEWESTALIRSAAYGRVGHDPRLQFLSEATAKADGDRIMLDVTYRGESPGAAHDLVVFNDEKVVGTVANTTAGAWSLRLPVDWHKEGCDCVAGFNGKHAHTWRATWRSPIGRRIHIGTEAFVGDAVAFLPVGQAVDRRPVVIEHVLLFVAGIDTMVITDESLSIDVPSNLTARRSSRLIRGVVWSNQSECRARRNVALFHRRPGRDARLRRTITDAFGRWTAVSIRRRAHYARIAGSTRTDMDTRHILECLGDQTRIGTRSART